MTDEDWNHEVFSLINQYISGSDMSKSELKDKFQLLVDNMPVTTLCEGCNKLFTNQIFKRKKDPSKGLCFKCF